MWRDVFGLLLKSHRQYGDVVRFRLGTAVIHLVAHPDHVRHVLIDNQRNYNKDTRSSARIRGISGAGLLTQNGEVWQRQRRLMQPVFTHHHLAGLMPIMTQAVSEVVERWQGPAQSGQPINVGSEMMRLTLTIVARCLFGLDVAGNLHEVERASTVVMAHTYRKLEHLINFPLWLPTPGNLRFRRAMCTLESVVERVFARQASGGEMPDLLSRLLRQRDEQTPDGMTLRQARDETITLLLAGHETTANALTWTWFLLAQYPEAAAQVRAEVEAVLGERELNFEDLSRLPYTTNVLQEAMRLYPPIWIMERRVLADDVIAGYRIPAGSTVALSPYVTHRHPAIWDEPQRFDPERFTPAAVSRRPPLAYFPFGAGQRLCIGQHFARMEAPIILAMLARRWRLDLVPGQRVEPKAGITLRPKSAMLMTVHPVSPGAGQ